MSSPLVTFIFKTFPKNRATQFWNFFSQIWKICNRIQLVRKIFEKKILKFDFFAFFSNKSYFFCLKLNSMWKMRFFLGIACWLAQKLQILKISPIFSDFSLDFQFSLILGGVMEKKFWKRVKWVGIEATFQGNMIFGQNLAPEPR